MASVVHLCEHSLLAQSPLLDSIQNTFSTGPNASEIVAFIIGAAVLIALILLAARFYANRGERDSEPVVDYLTVAVDVLGLSEADRRLLQKIAARADLRQPAAMLLSPENFSRAADPLWRAGLNDAGRQRIENLCQRLFDAPLPTPGKQPPRNS